MRPFWEREKRGGRVDETVDTESLLICFRWQIMISTRKYIGGSIMFKWIFSASQFASMDWNSSCLHQSVHWGQRGVSMQVQSICLNYLSMNKNCIQCYSYCSTIGHWMQLCIALTPYRWIRLCECVCLVANMTRVHENPIISKQPEIGSADQSHNQSSNSHNHSALEWSGARKRTKTPTTFLSR
jgi:hypothetical protein